MKQVLVCPFVFSSGNDAKNPGVASASFVGIRSVGQGAFYTDSLDVKTMGVVSAPFHGLLIIVPVQSLCNTYVSVDDARSAVALSLSAAVQDTFGRLQLNLKKTSDYFKRFIMYDSLCGAIYNQRMPPRR